MATSDATTPDEMIAACRRTGARRCGRSRCHPRRTCRLAISEGMLYGMIGYYVPLERFPDTYNGQPLGLAWFGQPEELHVALPEHGVRRPSDRTLVP